MISDSGNGAGQDEPSMQSMICGSAPVCSEFTEDTYVFLLPELGINVHLGAFPTEQMPFVTLEHVLLRY